MAKANPLMLKILFLGLPLLVGVAMLPIDAPKKQGPKSGQTSTSTGISHTPTLRSDVSDQGSVEKSIQDSLQRGEIPASMAGGDPSWTFTGTVTVNGVPKAVLENRRTGNAVFLGSGENWQQMHITAIGGTSVEFTDAEKNPHTVNLGGASPDPNGLASQSQAMKSAEVPRY